MINIKDIFNSWKTSFNPSERELKRANDRFSICAGCEFNKEVLTNKEWSLICKACGCPIKKKIFSSEINPCPKSKWMEVDKANGYSVDIKKNKTLI